jgi:hypothetical protein
MIAVSVFAQKFARLIPILRLIPVLLILFVAPAVVAAQQVPTRTVFTLAYIDTIPANDVDLLNQQLIDDLKLASRWHGYAHPGNPAALDYQPYGGAVLKLNEQPPHRSDNGLFDYAAVYQRFNLCALIQAEQVDEVWIWESGDGHAEEWVTIGPVWSMTKGMNVPNCGRTVSTLNLNYELPVDYALHSFGHRIEGALMTNRPCDFYTKTYPWTGWPAYCAGRVSDQLGYVGRPFSGNNNIGVCGDIHHPPNITDTREYIYDDPTTVQSTCQDVQWDGTAATSAINCQDWGCSQGGYMIWWMQNLPGIGSDSHDRYGKPMVNWWNYLFDPTQFPPVSHGTGLSGQYFVGTSLMNPVFTRNDPAINFFWGETSPDPRLPADGFSVRWTGQIEPAYSENYVFYAYSDDGVRLWINGQLLINDWFIRGETESTAAVDLQAGKRYDIRVDYFEDGGLAEVRLAWSSDTQPRGVVPMDRLYPPPASAVNAAPIRNYLTTASPILTWTSVTWATGYQVQVSRSTAFSPTVYDDSFAANALSATVSPPLGSGLYYWRVRAKKANGDWGTWGAIQTFTLAASP